MNNKDKRMTTKTTTIDRSHYPGIPEDFPIEAQAFSMAGSSPKLSLVQEGETYYAAGTSPQEVQQDYAEMEDLVRQLMVYCQAENLPSSAALDQFLARESHIMQMHYGIRSIHAAWVVKQVKLLIGQVPDNESPT